MTNELAFPHSFSNEYPTEIVGGMTLRDYFAARALLGLQSRSWIHTGTSEELLAIWARSAYAIADAMLEARKDA